MGRSMKKPFPILGHALKTSKDADKQPGGSIVDAPKEKA